MRRKIEIFTQNIGETPKRRALSNIIFRLTVIKRKQAKNM